MADLIVTAAQAQTETTVLTLSVDPRKWNVSIELQVSMQLPSKVKAGVARLRDGVGGAILASFNITDKGDSIAGTQSVWSLSGQYTFTGTQAVVTIQSTNANSPDFYSNARSITGTPAVPFTRASDMVTLAVLASITYTRTYYLLQASTLTAPAVPTTNPPAAPWSTTEPGYTAGSTNTLYTTQLTVYGAAGFAYGEVQKSSSYEAAKQAYNLADQASTNASSANGRITISTSAPLAGDGTGKAIGSIWYLKNAGNEFTNIWEWNGAAWQIRTITDSAITNLSAATISTGTLSADRIAANSINGNKLIANSVGADRIVANSITAGQIAANSITSTEMLAGTITAASGIIADAAITNAKISALDAAKITTGTLDANRIAANSISATQLLISDFSNLLEDPGFEAVSGRGWSDFGTKWNNVTTTPRTGTRTFRAIAGTAAKEVAKQVNPIRVEAGERYVYGAWVRADGASATVAGGIELGVLFGPDATTASNQAIALSPVVSTTYVYFSGVWTVPAGAKYVRPRIVVRSDISNVNAYLLDDLTFYKQTPGVLIQDGAITAGSAIITDGAITNAKIANATIEYGKIKSLDASTISTGSMHGDYITAGTITAKKLAISDTSNFAQIDVAQPGLVTFGGVTDTVVNNWSSRSSNTSATFMFRNQTGPLPFKTGDTVRITFDAYAASITAAAVDLWVYGNAALNQELATIPLTTTPTSFSRTATISVDTIGKTSFLVGLDGVAGKDVFVRNVRVYRMNAGELLVDGSLDAFQITGANIQTMAAANRGIKLNNAGLTAFNALGAQVISIDSATGNASFNGEFISGSGAAIFKATAQGISLGDPVFENAPFSVTASGSLYAANAQIVGNITATGGSITGSLTMFGGTINGANLNTALGTAPGDLLSSVQITQYQGVYSRGSKTGDYAQLIDGRLFARYSYNTTSDGLATTITELNGPIISLTTTDNRGTRSGKITGDDVYLTNLAPGASTPAEVRLNTFQFYATPASGVFTFMSAGGGVFRFVNDVRLAYLPTMPAYTYNPTNNAGATNELAVGANETISSRQYERRLSTWVPGLDQRVGPGGNFAIATGTFTVRRGGGQVNFNSKSDINATGNAAGTYRLSISATPGATNGTTQPSSTYVILRDTRVHWHGMRQILTAMLEYESYLSEGVYNIRLQYFNDGASADVYIYENTLSVWS